MSCSHDEAAAIAAEHIEWCRKRCLNMRHIMHSIGGPPVRTWDECFDQVAIAWLALSVSGDTRPSTKGISADTATKKPKLSNTYHRSAGELALHL